MLGTSIRVISLVTSLLDTILEFLNYLNLYKALCQSQKPQLSGFKLNRFTIHECYEFNKSINIPKHLYYCSIFLRSVRFLRIFHSDAFYRMSS